MEEEQTGEDQSDLSPNGMFINAIQTNNEDIFYRQVGMRRKNWQHPIDIQLAVMECCKHSRLEMLKSVVALHPNVNFQDAEGKRALHYAAMNGDLEIVEVIVKSGSSVNCYDKNSYCPIHWACENGHPEVVQYLITRGAHVNFSKIYSTGENPLHVACRAGHVEVVKVLLQSGADIHAKLDLAKNCQYTPLHVAIKHGKWRVVETLCRLGANINMKSSKGHTPLHVSAHRGELLCTKVLLQFGADISCKDNNDNTPLKHAIFEGYKETVRMLLLWEPEIFKHEGGNLPVIFASLNSEVSEILKIVIEAGADVNERRADNLESVLMAAIGNKDIEKIRILLEYNADVNVPDFKLYTPLHRAHIIKASDEEKCEISRLLINAGAKINAADREGFTPLHRAIFTNVIRSTLSLPCIKLLVEAGSRLWPGPSVERKNGQSPLCWVTWNNQLQVAEYLVQAGWDMSTEFWIKLTPSRPQQGKLHLVFLDIASNARSLRHCCRDKIRKFLSDITEDREIQTPIQLLPVPTAIKNYLSLHDCDFKDLSYFENL